MRYLLPLALLLSMVYASTTQAQNCAAGEVLVEVSILTDDYPQELSWTLIDLKGRIWAEVDLDATYTHDSVYTWEVCMTKNECAIFALSDSYGDGIKAPGNFSLSIDEEIVYQNSFSKDFTQYTLNCPPSYSCDHPHNVSPGQYLVTHDDMWYRFTPNESGRYQISTCNLASCDTKIWVFDNCQRAHFNEDNEATIAYDDSYTACAPQAELEVNLLQGKTYYLRVGDDHDDCDGLDWHWSLTFLGQVSGCTDPNSCNFDPTATVDDGSCIPNGDPTCPEAPDLVIHQGLLESSIKTDQIQSSNACLVEEGCLQGYGLRDILRFSTRIDNIGDADYFIGDPGPGNPQFTYDNCHGHWHYDGYAEYLLFDEYGQEIPIGFKNGFCVLDLACPQGDYKYSCSYMGISTGCYDEYWAELECQWVDVTDVPDGDYTLVVRVNWDNAPDALGRRELDTLNNWGQLCVALDRSSGSLKFRLNDDCDPYVDCAGIPYGNTSIDCNGDCGGSTKFGDLDSDGRQETEDVSAYLNHIVEHSLAASSCTDLSDDDRITVYDAALLSSCALFGEAHPNAQTGPRNYCRFPRDVHNINQFASLTILDYNFDQKYFEIGLKTTQSNLLAYQFSLNGIDISTVENLIDPNRYPIQPYTDGDSIIVGLSLQDSTILRSEEWQPLVRVYYEGEPDTEVCFGEITDLVNANYERITGHFENPCVLIIPTALEEQLPEIAVQVYPNPLHNWTELSFANPQGDHYSLEIRSTDGRLLPNAYHSSDESIRIDASNWAAGIYWYQLRSKNGVAYGKLIVQ